MASTSPCVNALAPVVVVFSRGLSAGTEGLQKLCDIIQHCPDEASKLSNAVRSELMKKLDEELLCAIVCCCEHTPSVSDGGRNGMQECVKQTLRRADQELGWRSRYKAEIAYDMTALPPRPIMHRDAAGNETTAPSGYWLTRAKEDIPGFKGGEGHVRIPDVVIVADPSRPPHAQNIDRVVEIKFEGDNLSREQEQAYTDIAGGRRRFSVMGSSETQLKNTGSSTKNCDCKKNRRNPQPQEVYAPSVRKVQQRIEEQSVNWGALLETVGWGAVTVLGAAATIAALVSPFEGPAGEAAAGVATAGAAARTAAAARTLFQSMFARPVLVTP